MTCHTTVVPAPNRKGCVIKLTGTIDENFDAKAMVEAATGVVVLDLKQVARITSFGVQKWTAALRQVVARSEYVGLIECGPAFVTQLNTVMGFSAGAQVVSFYAPLRCLSCDTETQKLIDLRVDHAWVRKLSLPEIRCTACGATSAIDDDPASYLAFVAGAPLPRPPALFDRLVKGELSVSPGLHVRKDVRNTVTGIWLKGALEPSPRFRRLGEGLEGEVVLVCRELESATAEGIEQLVTFLKASPSSTQLAQVPVCVATALRAHSGKLTLPGVCSAWLPFRCNNCDEITSLDSDLGQLNALLEGRAQLPNCHHCGGVLKEAFSSEELRQVRGLHLVPPTAEVAHYLRESASDFQGRDGEPFGRYQIVKSLGTSGSVEMLLARQTGIGGFTKHLVLKRLLPQYSQDRAAVDAFLEGARRGARISHPNVLQLTDFGEIDRRYYYALEHIRGWTLEDLLLACEKLNVTIPSELSALIVREVCNGLNAAHSNRSDVGEAEPITHGDVLPRHVLISSGGHVKLTDFGKPHVARSAASQVAVDVQSDIFSVGIILGQLLCAPSPLTFEGADAGTPNENGEERTPWEGRAPPELAKIAARAVHHDVTQRYATALALRMDLEVFLHQQGPTELGDWVKELIARSETSRVSDEMGAAGVSAATPMRPRSREEVSLPKSAAKLRVLFIAGGAQALEEGGALLRDHFEDVDAQPHLEKLETEPAHDLVVIDYDSLDSEAHAKIIERASSFRSKLPLIFISNGACKKDFIALFETQALTHLIGRNKTFDPTQLVLTARKLMSKDIFGIEPYLAKGAQVKSWVVNRASQKNLVIAETEEFLKKHSAPSRVSAAFLLVMDELFTNAIFNAPIDTEGKHRFRTLSRSEEVTLEPGEEVEVKLCHDGQRIGVSVADPFGSLSRKQLYEYLTRGLKKGENQMSTSGGGAGLGLYLLFQSLNHLVVNSYPTRRTEILGFMPIAASYRTATELNKSFDFFTTTRFHGNDES